MTITRVGGGVLRDNVFSSGTNNTQSPSLGVTTLANDIALVYVAAEDSSNAVTISVSGYTQLLANSGDNRDVEIWAKVCGAGESDPTVTYVGTPASAVNCKSYAEVIRGASTTLASIVHVSDANDANASANTLAYPGITITENGCYTGVLGLHRSNYNTWAATAAAAEWAERVNLGSNSQSMILYTGIQTTATNITASNFNSGGSATSAASFPIVFALLPSSLTKYVKVLVHPSAASASSVEVVVFNAPSGANYIVGDTRYGSTNGQAFEASTEGTGDDERAVLKVLASAVGCSGLAASTTVAVLARIAGTASTLNYATEAIAGTIIEE